MLLLIDNYDSFTHNLAQYLAELGQEVRVVRNDAIDTRRIARLAPECIVISPGPGTPERAGISLAIIRRFAGHVPILGVCLGHQVIGQAFGGRVVRAARIMHGKVSEIRHDGRGVFAGLENPLRGMRYHSLILDPATLPADLEVSATTDLGEEIMGVRHRALAQTATPVEGVQFHPESIETPAGKRLLENFLRMSSLLLRDSAAARVTAAASPAAGAATEPRQPS